ncbi:trypsin-7-like [Schistocerca nitens]|uniref:trypsin-7-like n=1 Tax=Schistocerca nitens TaxID=7011 RepID=UPI002117F0F6|nr:trypsin-7-like [Schistocerca nitens]
MKRRPSASCQQRPSTSASNTSTMITSVAPLCLAAIVLAAAAHHAQIPPNRPASSVQLHYNQTSGQDCQCSCGVPNRRQRIVGGNVTRVNEFPWVAALSRRGKFYCGGTLISRHHVLTAAHCVDGLRSQDILVTLGEHDRGVQNESASLERGVADWQRHDNFSIFTFNHDIALIRLDKPVDFGTSVRPACLPVDNTADYTDRVAIVTGWGRVEERKPTSATLRKVAVPIMSMEKCRRAGYPSERITDNMICAGYPQGKRDACQGDSGGPLHVDNKNGSMEVIGIVSWGRGCARPNYPGIYTRVANYLPWLHQRLAGDCLCAPP